MIYVLTSAHGVEKYPYTVWDLKEDHPNVSFPLPLTDEIIASYGVYEVKPTPQPNYDQANEYVVEADPVSTVDGWRQAWIVKPLDPEQKQQIFAEKVDSVRFDRNKRLAECDWTQLPDAPVDHATWATYRQELRDVTSQVGFPWNVIWPVKPV